jgi:cytidyltransferase-like protein
MSYKYKHAIMVGRFQPLHMGQIRLIDQMLKECEQVTIVIGSSQEFGTTKNPFRFRERKEMITNYYHDEAIKKRMKIVGQIDTNDFHGWVHTVLDTIADAYEDKRPVEALYCGLPYDSQWYTPDIKKIELVSRTDPKFPYISGTLVREQCMFQDARWKQLVPEVNHEFMETLARRFMLDSKPR